MNKIVLIAAIFCLTEIVNGQGAKFTFGPQIGWSSANLTANLNNNYSDFKSASKSGFQYGAFFRLGRKTYVQPEVYFSSKGGIMDYDVSQIPVTNGDHVSQDVTLRTIDVPLLLGHRIINSQGFNFRVFIGPVASFIIDKNINLTDGSENSKLFTKDDFKNTIWAGQVGGGFDILMLTFNVSYEYGLNDISNSPNFSKVRNNLFLITAGWKIL